MNATVHIAPSMDGSYVFKCLRPRLIVASLVSLFIHAFILSLEFGIPGLGLPGLQAFWSERRAQDTSVTIWLADTSGASGTNKAESTSGMAQPSAADGHSQASPASPAATLSVPPESPPYPSAPQAGPASSLLIYPSRSFEQAPPSQELDSTPADAVSKQPSSETAPNKHARKAEKRNRANAVAKQKARREKSRSKPSQPVIARTDTLDDSFTVPLPQIAELEPQLDTGTEETEQAAVSIDNSEPLSASAAAEEMEPVATNPDEILFAKAESIVEQPPHDANAEAQLENLRVKEQVLALETQKRVKEEQRLRDEEARRVEQAAAQKLVEEQEKRREQEQLAQLQIEEARERTRRQEEAQKQVDELHRQRASQLEEEVRRAQLAAQRQQQDAARKAMELEAQRQAEQLAREQAAQKLREEAIQQAQQTEMERQQAAQARIAQSQNQLLNEANARQASAVPARLGSTHSHGASNTSSQVNAGGSDAQAKGTSTSADILAQQASGNATQATEEEKNRKQPEADAGGPIMLSDEQLDSLKAVQVKNVHKDRLEPWQARELETAMQASRRRTILGKAEDDLALKMYIDEWNRQIERIGEQNYPKFSKQPNHHPIVTVAIRSDGSVENISIIQSSGESAIDDSIKEIIGLTRHKAFPRNLARQYDVIEIRRLWQFAEKLKLLEASR